MSNLKETLAAIQDAIEEKQHSKAGTACAQAGQIFLERNLYRDAGHYYREASDHFAAVGENMKQAKALNHLGICLIMDEDPPAALQVLEKALVLVDTKQDLTLTASIQGNLGLGYSALQDYQNAIKAHKSVMETAEDAGDDRLRLNALINLADSNLQNKNYTSALGFALVAQDLAKELKSKPALVIIYDLLGMISSRQKNLKTAVTYHQKSYEAAIESGDLLRQAISLANKGLALEGLTEIEEAFEAMSQAETLFRMLNSSYLEKTRRDLARLRTARAGMD